MSYNLLLYDRPARSNAFQGNITSLQNDTWRRSSVALGGHNRGQFLIEKASNNILVNAFQRWIGARLVEKTYGLTSWEGIITEMRLLLDGYEYKISLNPDWWHNRVKIFYSYPDTDDTNQGNLSYTSEGGNDTFTDDAQDFSEWEMTSGDATHRIRVTNADDTEAWGFLGAAVSNTEVYVYKEVELSTHGWSGEYLGKTPSSYAVSNVGLAGSRQNVDWSANSDSQNEYGRMEYVVTLGGATPEAAEQLQASHLDEFAWPRPRMTGSVEVTPGKNPPENKLLVRCRGFWETLNWRYRSSSRIAPASTLVNTIVGQSEFITAGCIDTNDMAAKIDCEPIPQRLGDLLEMVAEQGDMDGNLWEIGVYEDQELVYEQADTAITHYLRGGRLVDKAGTPVIPTLLKPGFLLKNSGAPFGGQQPGTSNVWDDPQVAYVDEVRFRAPNKLQLRLYGEEESIVTLTERIRLGTI